MELELREKLNEIKEVVDHLGKTMIEVFEIYEKAISTLCEIEKERIMDKNDNGNH